ncbi:hypothetical protein GCM10025868_01160 [Angustibacter aerolatus]|uniref:Uncharacterized protein n=1 Tax=Angustibacter aerolatus TaxID=1162965 RepID=A0ABQ6J9K8_9ACTN|nr:hypothetical protein GCM10025868_01160 [Angustibacter aerolatus]
MHEQVRAARCHVHLARSQRCAVARLTHRQPGAARQHLGQPGAGSVADVHGDEHRRRQVGLEPPSALASGSRLPAEPPTTTQTGGVGCRLMRWRYPVGGAACTDVAARPSDVTPWSERGRRQETA